MRDRPRVPLTLYDWELIKETFSSFGLGLGIFLFLFVMSRVMSLSEIIARGASPIIVMALILSAVVSSLGFAFPPSYLFSVLISVGRLSADGELIALLSSGISLKRIAYPLVTLSLGVVALSLTFQLYIAPLSNRAIKGFAVKAMMETPSSSLKPGEFLQLRKGIWIHCGRVKGKKIKDVFLYDSGRKTGIVRIIMAKKAKVSIDPLDNTLNFAFRNGHIYSKLKDGYKHLSFKLYVLSMENPFLSGSMGSETKRDLPLPALLSRLKRDRTISEKRYLNTLLHLHKRFAVPFSALVFAFLGIPLGVFARRSGKWTGSVITLGGLMLYFGLLALFQDIALKGLLPAGLAVWTPNLLLGGTGLWLIKRKSERVGL